jgi:histone-lysine N-methyltransferase SETMAR
LRQLPSIGPHGWQFIITLDESWFYLSTDHEQIWLRVEGHPPERPRHTIQEPKMIVTIAWNPLGFHLLDALPKGNTFNVKYYLVNLLTEFLPLHPEVDGRRLVIHADNKRPHIARKYRVFCKENLVRLAVYPAYSPNLAPSDFFLFGHIKHCLRGIAFPSREEL